MKGPSPQTLDALQRVADRRAEVEAVKAADDRQAAIRRYLLATLDLIEEAICLRGPRTGAVRAGWKRLADFESFGRPNRDGGASDGTVDKSD